MWMWYYIRIALIERAFEERNLIDSAQWPCENPIEPPVFIGYAMSLFLASHLSS